MKRTLRGVLLTLVLTSSVGAAARGAEPTAPARPSPTSTAASPSTDNPAKRGGDVPLGQELRSAEQQVQHRLAQEEDLASDLGHRLRAFTPALVAAALLLLFFYLLQRFTVRLVAQLLHRAHVNPAIHTIGQRLTRYTIMTLGILAAARQLGFEVGELLAGLGIVGLGISLAAQDLLSNLIAGFTILFEKPFGIGDSVTVAGVSGEVREIGLRFTMLLTPDLREVYLPNREVVAKAMVNNSRGPRRRLDLRFLVAYGTDLLKVREVLLAVAAGSEYVLREPAARVVVVDLVDAGIAVELRIWLPDPAQEFEAKVELLEKAERALRAADVEQPVPQRIVQVEAARPVAADEARAAAGVAKGQPAAGE